MQKGGVWADRLEKLFIWYLFANPLFDIVNGLFIFLTNNFGTHINSWQFPITPTLLVRLLFLGLMGIYILLRNDWKALRTLVMIGVVGIVSTVIAVFWIRNGYNTFTDMQYIARFLYNVAALLVYTKSLTCSGRQKRSDVMAILRRFFTWSALVVAGSIILCFVLSSILSVRIGFFSYADRFGYRGASGFYYAANEATAILMLLLPLTIYDFLQIPLAGYKDTKNWPKFLAPALTLNAMLLIGTKTAYIAILLSAIAITAFYAWQSYRNRPREALRRFAVLLAVIFLIFLLLSLCGLAGDLLVSLGVISKIAEEDPNERDLSHIEDLAQRESIRNSHWLVRLLLSGRQYYLGKTASAWARGGPLSWAFGVGRSSQIHTIEMDLFEMLFYYGIIGFIILMLPYAVPLWRLVKNLFKNKPHLLSFSILLALGLTFFYAAIAGHVLFSVTGGFYFVMIMVYGDFFFRAEGVHPKVKAREKKARS